MKVGKLELLKLQGFNLVEKDGKKFIYADIEKTRMFYSKESGRLYLDLVMFETPNSEYSDYSVSESKKQDEEISLPIVGNFKNWGKKADEKTADSAPTTPQPEGTQDDLPF